MENTPEKNLMTVEQFNKIVTDWALRLRYAAKGTLASETHGSGHLSQTLWKFIDKYDDHSPAYKVAFRFERYGVFRAYGVGRGYIREGGRIMRGQRVVGINNLYQSKKWSSEALQMLKRGYTNKEVRERKRWNETAVVKRKPLDWLDHHVDERINTLADYVQEYYGDRALRSLAYTFSNAKIVK